MKILIACEFSGIVREAFVKRGHDVLSCDFLDSEIQGNHYKGDVRDLLYENWDLMIAHPPCKFICVSGARWFKNRKKQQGKALRFVKELMSANIPSICIENPISIISTRIKKPDQIIQPWHFGHYETKSTCLWLKNLPKLKPTKIVSNPKHTLSNLGPGINRSKYRSITFKGIANAMANQWNEKTIFDKSIEITIP